MNHVDIFAQAFLACSNAMFAMFGTFIRILHEYGAMSTVVALVSFTIIANRFFKSGGGSDKANANKSQKKKG